jgi:acyl-CoA thioester hydrolase
MGPGVSARVRGPVTRRRGDNAAPMTEPAYALDLRVYWEDTDAGGVVFYANYLKFFERARTEWLRALGVEQQRLKDESRLIFVVVGADIRYHAPARLDDVLRIDVALAHSGPASLLLAQRALRAGTLLAAAQVRIGCVNADTWRAQRLPPALLAALNNKPAA